MRVRPCTISLATNEIVIGRDHITLIGGRIDANAETAGRVKISNSTWRGRECARMLGIDAAFNRGAKEANFVLRNGQRRSCGNLDLLIDNINSGDHLGHGVFDLHARIHLNEEEFTVLVQELDRSGADVAKFGHGRGDNPPMPSRCSGFRAGEGPSSQTFW